MIAWQVSSHTPVENYRNANRYPAEIAQICNLGFQERQAIWGLAQTKNVEQVVALICDNEGGDFDSLPVERNLKDVAR